jgi:hypothetical protein
VGLGCDTLSIGVGPLNREKKPPRLLFLSFWAWQDGPVPIASRQLNAIENICMRLFIIDVPAIGKSKQM